MKKIRIFFLALLFFVIAGNKSNAQCVVNTQTTDWREYNGGNGPSPNDFNWTNTGLSYPVYLQNNLDAPSLNIELPYFCTQSASSGSCGNKNTLQYELLGNSAAQQDIKPEDGWELVLKNFGIQNLTPADNTGRGVGNPFFVLYNRHNGKMKVFLAVMGARTASSITLRVGFESSGNKHTALFSHAEPITQIFKDFNNSLAVNTLNDIAEKLFVTDYYWTVSEFQTAYDPCACERPQGSNLPSIITVEPELITTQNVDLTIEGSVLQSLMNNGSVQSDGGKTTSVTDIPNAAQNAYNTWNGYKNTVNTILNNYNQKYKDKLINNWWKNEVLNDPQLAGSIPESFIPTLFDQYKSSDDGFKELAGIDNLTKYNKTFDVIKGIASTAPYVGTAIGLIEFFSEGGKEQPQPSPPLSFNVSLDATGTITTSTPLTGFSFHNPGTINPNDPSGAHLKPFYNNVLGVFNILTEPNFEHYKIEPNVILDNQLINPHQYPENDWVDAENAPLKQFFMTNDIKYAINPASNLEVEVIDAAYCLEYDGSDDLSLSDPSAFTTTKALPFHDIMHFGELDKTLDERIESYERAGMNLEYISANYPNTGSLIRFRTPYVPLKCLPNVNLVLFGGAGNPKVYIKLLVRMKRTDNPNAANVTQIITYDVSSSFNNSTELLSSNTFDAHLFSEDVFQDQNLITNYTDVRYNFFKHNGLPLDNIYQSPHNVTYDPSIHTGNLNATGDITIPNYTNIPDGTVIRAFGRIIVGGSVTFGNNVELRAGEIIDIPSTTVINPTMTLIIEPNISLTAFNCTSSDVVSLKGTQAEIDAICSSDAYKLNSGQAKNDPSEFENSTSEEASITDCHIYPNPTTSKLYINLQLEKEVAYSIKIMDVQGKDLISHKYSGKIGKNIEGIDVSYLPAGVYFINIKTENYQKTDKFLVIR